MEKNMLQNSSFFFLSLNLRIPITTFRGGGQDTPAGVTYYLLHFSARSKIDIQAEFH